MSKIFLSTILFLIISFQNSFTQVSPNSDLFQQLKSLDSLLFDRAFNHCELEYLEKHVADDLEFFHDQGGIDKSRAAFIAKVEANICSNPTMKPIRKLVAGSMKVFPLYTQGKLYGAIQNGSHEFFIKEPEKEVYKTSIAKFTHVWLVKNEEWLLSKVLSFDHQSP